jgi:4,5-DOPA dioxygenase extradiol
MNAIEENEITKNWQYIGKNLPTPKAILCISAHWVTNGTTEVTTSETLKTIYEFYGFPPELYNLNYDVQGSPEFAKETQHIIETPKILWNDEWGIDHGAWSVLIQMYPRKNIPVYQLSLDYGKPFSFHLELGIYLRELRKKWVLIIGSGNLVHNLGRLNWNSNAPYDWNREFDIKATQFINERKFEALTKRESFWNTFSLAHPNYDHYLPLLYFAGTIGSDENIISFNEEFQMGSLSMKSFMAY